MKVTITFKGKTIEVDPDYFATAIRIAGSRLEFCKRTEGELPQSESATLKVIRDMQFDLGLS